MILKMLHLTYLFINILKGALKVAMKENKGKDDKSKMKPKKDKKPSKGC